MISRPYSTVEFYTTSTPNSVSSYCNNTLVLRVRDSYYKYQSVKRTEAPACPLAQASCTTRTSDSPTRLYVSRSAVNREVGGSSPPRSVSFLDARTSNLKIAGSSPAVSVLFNIKINVLSSGCITKGIPGGSFFLILKYKVVSDTSYQEW
ncbi:hypothetical protein H8356DRAFT_1435802 [Neocallimastix lanati (nom. inval.)]|nr:hypothetical protein H8356DRAFT_1435802 [Neocallimastix sp. JGI-2020a]